MIHHPRIPGRQGRIALLSLLLAGCHNHSAEGPVPSDYNRLPFASAAGAVTLAAADQEAIYLRVLQFYRSAGSDTRRIEEQLLPVSAADLATPFDPALARRLVQQLGSTHYCFSGTVPSCLDKMGGGLRLSIIDGLAADQARVAVHYSGGQVYAPGAAFSGTEVFLMRREPTGWRIVAHAPAGS
ncbi:MAG: hypothetical protein ABI765_17125 [Gemmatimonadota bacterium]